MDKKKKKKKDEEIAESSDPSNAVVLSFLANCLRKPRKNSDSELCRLFRLSRKQLANLRVAFNMFDLDRDGAITAEELGQVMNNLGQATKGKELKAMIMDVDVDRSGNVDFYEFLQMMTQRMDEKTREEDLKDAFRAFDRDGDGQISMRELRLAMAKLGEVLTGEELNEMMQTVDTNQDGQINFEEFIKIIQLANERQRNNEK